MVPLSPGECENPRAARFCVAGDADSDLAVAVLQAVLEREGKDRDVTGAAKRALTKLGEE